MFSAKARLNGVSEFRTKETTMKKRLIILGFVSFATLLLQGCVAFPPLVSVEHKENPAANAEVIKRLDAIDQRLAQLEQKTEKKQ
jgi:hypothetical protein